MMIYIRKEGEKFMPGLNLMWRPWIQVYIMIGTYNRRIVFGPAWSRRVGKFRWLFGTWTLEDDIDQELQLRGYRCITESIGITDDRCVFNECNKRYINYQPYKSLSTDTKAQHDCTQPAALDKQ